MAKEDDPASFWGFRPVFRRHSFILGRAYILSNLERNQLCQEKAGVRTRLTQTCQGRENKNCQSFVSNFMESILLFWSFHVSIVVWLKYTKQDSENEMLLASTAPSLMKLRWIRVTNFAPTLISLIWHHPHASEQKTKLQSHYKLSFFCLVTPISTPNSWNPHI